MINYTERIDHLMRDLIARVPRLAYIDPDQVLVFARYGRRDAAGAFATCHCLSLPTTEPGYYYWRDLGSGRITRRSRWFVTKSPAVQIDGRSISYLISFTLPRFCEQALTGSRKARYYDRAPAWTAKLDTIVHEMYHIDPAAAGIRCVERSDGRAAVGAHGRTFLASVAEMVREYLASDPDPAAYEFLRDGFAELDARHGGVVATTFRTFPSFPQRYIELVQESAEPATPVSVRIQPLRTPVGPTCFTERDLAVRQFLDSRTRAIARREERRHESAKREMPRAVAAEVE